MIYNMNAPVAHRTQQTETLQMVCELKLNMQDYLRVHPNCGLRRKVASEFYGLR